MNLGGRVTFLAAAAAREERRPAGGGGSGEQTNSVAHKVLKKSYRASAAQLEQSCLTGVIDWDSLMLRAVSVRHSWALCGAGRPASRAGRRSCSERNCAARPHLCAPTVKLREQSRAPCEPDARC